VDNISDELFAAARLARYGDGVAIECAGRTLTYRQLAARSEQIASALGGNGAEPGDRIVMRASDTEGLVAAILGAMQAGFVPVILSPRVSDDDLPYIADETGAVLFVENDPDSVGEVSIKKMPTVPGGGPGKRLPGEAFWLYSSGTTGRMKGVIHGHQALAPVLSFHRDTLQVGPGSRTFCTSRISFAYAMSNGLLAPLALGATVILHADWPSPESTLEMIRTARPDVIFSVPSMYRAWLELPGDQLEPMAAAERFVSAGEHLPVPVGDRWRDLCSRNILDCYGCSETCFLTFASTDQAKPASVGTPCADVEAVLRDETGAVVGAGGTGSLFIRHPFLALAYGPAAADDAQARFQDGWFATGDIFRCDDDGYWFHDGREDDWLKVAGQWVSLRRVEEVAAGFDGVSAAAGVSAKDADGFLRIAVFVVPAGHADEPTLVGRLQAYLDEALPTFKRPKWIRTIDVLPQTSTGKVRKVELKGIIEEGHGTGEGAAP